MERCFSSLFALVEAGQPCALVTVAGVAGSAPREAGARMIVAPDQLLGTIGGGNLEFEAARIARARLADPAAGPRRFVELFPLGPMLEQCCGGAVYLHFELFAAATGEAPATLVALGPGGRARQRPRRVGQSGLSGRAGGRRGRGLRGRLWRCSSAPGERPWPRQGGGDDGGTRRALRGRRAGPAGPGPGAGPVGRLQRGGRRVAPPPEGELISVARSDGRPVFRTRQTLRFSSGAVRRGACGPGPDAGSD